MKNTGVILLGFRGAGKSTVAELLAKAMNLHVIDLDQRLERRTKKPLPEFIMEHGEKAFRKLEAEELQVALNETPPFLLVSGGGVVDGEESMLALQRCTFPQILLHCAPEVIWERLKCDPERLKVGGLESFSDLQRLWTSREVKFRSLATFTVDSQDLSQAAAEVGRILKEIP